MRKMIEDFLKYLSLHGVSPKSLKYYKSDLLNFLTWANGKKVSQNLINEYVETIRLITPTSTLKRRLSTLRSYSSFLGIKKITVTWQENILQRFTNKPKLHEILYKLFFNRPNWYKKYHSYPIANYIHIAILVIFSSLSAYALYDQVFRQADDLSAFPTALTRPNRYLSFQGRLTSNLGNPITIATDVVFKLHTASSGGSELWNSGTCSITPDSDGIFSTLLGSSCGAEIASSVFSENAGVWASVTIAADAEATPRIQIATVAYALNAETLQGFPAGTGTSTIPYLNSSGEVVIAAASPKLQSTSGTFSVEGVALTITTPNASNGVITVNPDGTGTLNLTFEGLAAGGSVNGFVNAVNANITSGALYGGTVASAATGYNFIDFQSGVSPTSKFSVNNAGDITTAGDLLLSGGNLNTGNIALVIGDATTDTLTLTTDGTGNGEVVLPNDSISPNEIMSTDQTDEYCLTYEATGATWAWQSCGGGTWSSITAPTTDLTLTMATYNTTFNWDPGADSTETNFSLTTQGEDTVAGGEVDQTLLALSQTSNGADVDQAADSLLTLTNNDTNDPVTSAIRFDAGAAGTDFTYGINFDAADIGTAEIILENAETIDNQTDGTVAITAATTSLSGNLKLSGGNILNSVGTATVVLSSAPTTTANTLSAGNWMVDNTANVGQAALIVNQQKAGDLFTATSSATTKFTIENDGDVNMVGDITVGGGNINTGNIAFVIGDATTDGITFTTDGTGNGEYTFSADGIGDVDLDWGTGAGQIDVTDVENGSVNILLETEIDASSELLALMDDETGTGALVFANTPTLVTPEIGVATGTSLDLGGTTLYASRAITVDTGGVLNISLATAAGDDFTVDTNKLVVEGDNGNVGIGLFFFFKQKTAYEMIW